MYIELMIRVAAEMSEQEMEEQRLYRLTSGDDRSEDTPINYTYRPIVFDIDDVTAFCAYDEGHVEIRTIHGFLYAQLTYDHFRAIFRTMKDVGIKTLDDFKIINKR